MLVHAVFEMDAEEFEAIDRRLPGKVSFLSKHGQLDGPQLREIEAEIKVHQPINSQDIELLAIQLEEDDVVLFRYPADLDPEDAMFVKDVLKAEFPGNKVLGLTSDIELLVENADEAVSMLEKMIAHIKVQEMAPKIVLPT